MKRPPDFIVGNPDDPYLRRWWIIPRNKQFNIYLHHFLHSDEDRANHDHPWWNLSILLKGSYLEHFQDGSVHIRKPWRPWAFWRFTVRRPETAHRVELMTHPAAPWERTPRPKHVWTLFITGPNIREWGFHCPAGWKHWKEFTKPGAPGQIGPGCDQ